MSQPASSVPAEQPPAGGRVPDFFLVGHAKCGTTALWEMLRSHPQVFMPAVKEPQFFARNQELAPPAEGKVFEQTGRGVETLAEYLSLFAPAGPGQRVGEASTFYLWSRRAPGAIAAMRPDARIVAILREPASFLYSLHLQMLQNGVEDERDLRRALELEQERRQGRRIPPRAFWPEALMYSERVRYAEQLRRYRDEFGPEQVLVLLYDEFRDENAATLRRVLRFLDVDEQVRLAPVSANPTVGVRSLRAAGMMREVRAGRGSGARAVRAAVRAMTTSGMRARALYPLRRRLLFAAPPASDPGLMEELRERFRGEVEAAGELLGRDLVTLWGYDRPA
jgi:hypothetical protein